MEEVEEEEEEEVVEVVVEGGSGGGGGGGGLDSRQCLGDVGETHLLHVVEEDGRVAIEGQLFRDLVQAGRQMRAHARHPEEQALDGIVPVGVDRVGGRVLECHSTVLEGVEAGQAQPEREVARPMLDVATKRRFIFAASVCAPSKTL